MKSRPSLPRRSRGLTLIELLTALVVLAVMMVIAVPNLRGMIRSSKVRAAQSELVASLMFARSEAVRRGSRVRIAATAPVAGSEFSAGWQVFLDANDNSVLDAGETILRTEASVSQDVNIAFFMAGGVKLQIMGFNPNGFTDQAGQVSFKVCGKTDTTSGYRIDVPLVGLADILNDATVTCP
jgi:prepilin-type N-terminal cleavage/methylation domain-containing protein